MEEVPVEMLSGEELVVLVGDDGSVSFKDQTAKVVSADVTASNGVIHVVTPSSFPHPSPAKPAPPASPPATSVGSDAVYPAHHPPPIHVEGLTGDEAPNLSRSFGFDTIRLLDNPAWSAATRAGTVASIRRRPTLVRRVSGSRRSLWWRLCARWMMVCVERIAAAGRVRRPPGDRPACRRPGGRIECPSQSRRDALRHQSRSAA